MSRVIEVGPRGGKRVGFYYDKHGRKHYRYEQEQKAGGRPAGRETPPSELRDGTVAQHSYQRSVFKRQEDAQSFARKKAGEPNIVNVTTKRTHGGLGRDFEVTWERKPGFTSHPWSSKPPATSAPATAGPPKAPKLSDLRRELEIEYGRLESHRAGEAIASDPRRKEEYRAMQKISERKIADLQEQINARKKPAKPDETTPTASPEVLPEDPSFKPPTLPIVGSKELLTSLNRVLGAMRKRHAGFDSAAFSRVVNRGDEAEFSFVQSQRFFGVSDETKMSRTLDAVHKMQPSLAKLGLEAVVTSRGGSPIVYLQKAGLSAAELEQRRKAGEGNKGTGAGEDEATWVERRRRLGYIQPAHDVAVRSENNGSRTVETITGSSRVSLNISPDTTRTQFIERLGRELWRFEPNFHGVEEESAKEYSALRANFIDAAIRTAQRMRPDAMYSPEAIREEAERIAAHLLKPEPVATKYRHVPPLPLPASRMATDPPNPESIRRDRDTVAKYVNETSLTSDQRDDLEDALRRLAPYGVHAGLAAVEEKASDGTVIAHQFAQHATYGHDVLPGDEVKVYGQHDRAGQFGRVVRLQGQTDYVVKFDDGTTESVSGFSITAAKGLNRRPGTGERAVEEYGRWGLQEVPEPPRFDEAEAKTLARRASSIIGHAKKESSVALSALRDVSVVVRGRMVAIRSGARAGTYPTKMGEASRYDKSSTRIFAAAQNALNEKGLEIVFAREGSMRSAFIRPMQAPVPKPGSRELTPEEIEQRRKAGEKSTGGGGARDARLPAVGTKVERVHKGSKYSVVETPDGRFMLEAHGDPRLGGGTVEIGTFTSLSKAAQHITGVSTNGYRFFGLTGAAQPQPKVEPKIDEPKPPATGGRGAHTDARVPDVGTVLRRTFKGREHVVTVKHDHFEYNGQKHSSLSAVGKAITGGAVNGYAFFGLKGDGGGPKPPAPKVEKPDEPSALQKRQEFRAGVKSANAAHNMSDLGNFVLAGQTLAGKNVAIKRVSGPGRPWGVVVGSEVVATATNGAESFHDQALEWAKKMGAEPERITVVDPDSKPPAAPSRRAQGRVSRLEPWHLKGATRVRASGNTYAQQKMLKQLGGVWNAETKEYELEPSKALERESFYLGKNGVRFEVDYD